MTQPHVLAGATIEPSRFIQMEPAGTNAEVIACVADTFAIGITTEAAADAPQDGSGTFAAEAGDVVQYIGWGEEALLEADGTGWSSGVLLKSGAAGLGDVADTADDIACAISLEAAAAGEFGRVLVMSPFRIHA